MRKLILGLPLLALFACQGLPNEQANVATLTLAQSCDAYAGALRVLTPQKAAGLLSADEIATVNQANATADLVCQGEPPANPAEAIARVNAAVTTIMLIAAQEGN